MRYKRQEPLRYTFSEPIQGKFIILLDYKNDQSLQETGEGQLDIIDLSPSGLRFTTNLDLHLNKKDFMLEVTFTFMGEELKMIGKVAWKKERVETFEYGLNGVEDDEKEQQVITFLKKIHAKEK